MNEVLCCVTFETNRLYLDNGAYSIYRNMMEKEFSTLKYYRFKAEISDECAETLKKKGARVIRTDNGCYTRIRIHHNIAFQPDFPPEHPVVICNLTKIENIECPFLILTKIYEKNMQ